MSTAGQVDAEPGANVRGGCKRCEDLSIRRALVPWIVEMPRGRMRGSGWTAALEKHIGFSPVQVNVHPVNKSQKTCALPLRPTARGIGIFGYLVATKFPDDGAMRRHTVA